MDWLYKGKSIKCLNDFENSEEIVGFNYLITNKLNGSIYCGRKILHHSRRTKISKRDKLLTPTRKVFKTTIKESDWLTYNGSCLELKNDIKKLGIENFKKEIIELCYSKKYLSYAEVKHQIQLDVLSTLSYNGNIAGKWFRKDMQNDTRK